jgi:hypothetical protein
MSKKTRPALNALSLLLFSVSALAADDLHVFTNTLGRTIRGKLIGTANGQVSVLREDGKQVTFPLAMLSAADQDYVKSASASAASSPGAPATPVTSKFAAGPNDKVAPEQVNAAVGVAMFGEAPLWESAASEVAEKVSLREESKTKTQSSYRLYPKDDLQMFGAHPYSVALYAENDKVNSLSLVFANKGDLFSAKGGGELHFDKDTPPAEAAKIVKTAMDKDIAAISATLSKALGQPRKERFGEGKSGVGRMNMQRWDWRGHAILLAEAEGEYVGIQIVTQALADAGGKVPRTSDMVIRAHAKSNIENRENGDVVINDIPMVDQGPKGYCVPATAERAMRFMGVPADMYVLANAGGTGYGGGTSVDMLLQGVGQLIRAKSRSFDSWDGPIKLKDIEKYVNKGVPIMWALFSSEKFNDTANERTADRKQTTDWAKWKIHVTDAAAMSLLPKDKESAHVALIIGYNKTTGEIAFSDSWGERYKERWITVTEAEQVSQQRFYVVGF